MMEDLKVEGGKGEKAKQEWLNIKRGLVIKKLMNAKPGD